MEQNREIPDNTLLEVSNIDVFHESFQALWDVSIPIKKQEIVVIKGANGSGKSTLLDTISGQVHPAKGSIKFDGKDISSLKPFQIVDLGISQIPEGGRMFPDLSVLENLIIGSFNRKARFKREYNLQVVYQIFPGLKERKDQLAKTLSDGEQQMLAIGRGLMSDTKLLLLDEMSKRLASILIDELYKILKQIRERGISILLVEQNLRNNFIEVDRAYFM